MTWILFFTVGLLFGCIFTFASLLVILRDNSGIRAGFMEMMEHYEND